MRHNLKQVSYGHIAILKTEVMGLLNAAFEILDSPDIRHLFGSNSAWDTLERSDETASLKRPSSASVGAWL